MVEKLPSAFLVPGRKIGKGFCRQPSNIDDGATEEAFEGIFKVDGRLVVVDIESLATVGHSRKEAQQWNDAYTQKNIERNVWREIT